MVDDLPQVVAALDAVFDLAEDLANLVFDGVRPAGFLLEPVQVREQFPVDEGEQVVAGIRADEMLSEIVGDKLMFYTTVTRQPYRQQKRITDLVRSGELFTDLGIPPWNPATDRAMICGSMEMLKETRELCEAAGLIEGSNAAPGTFVVERAFVD